MLLEFKTKNYKSFKDGFVFSMQSTPKQKGLDYSILKQKIGSTTHKALCSSVVYGPNASGKTNIIGAMDAFKSIVLRGNIRNAINCDSPNPAANILELIPNCKIVDNEPIGFTILFIDNGILIEYSFDADIGRFLQSDYNRKIVYEELKINGKQVFERNNELVIDNLTSINHFLNKSLSENEQSAVSLAKNNLNDDELFLNNGFKTIFSTKLTSLINGWLERRLIIIFRADSMLPSIMIHNPKEKLVYTMPFLYEAVKIFGISSNAIGYIKEDNEVEPKLVSFIKTDGNEEGTVILADKFESYGTVRFAYLLPHINEVIRNGGTIVIDEFDASIHPMALMSITNVFHNDEINVHKAQLIFNTHNPIFLNSNLFRRDEIKFTDRDDKTGYSEHYSLSDFGTRGENGVRKEDDYQKDYFISRYGAIKDIDFSPIFDAVADESKEV